MRAEQKRAAFNANAAQDTCPIEMSRRATSIQLNIQNDST